jgi:hypothetical protein
MGMLISLFAVVLFSAPPLRGSEQYSPYSQAQRTDRELVQIPDDKTQKLLTIIRDEELRRTEPERVAKAIIELGENKSVISINDLVQLLAFSRTFDEETRNPLMIVGIHPITPFDRYPASAALEEIGRPAIPALTKVIETHDGGFMESQNAMNALTSIFSPDLIEGVAYLRRAAVKSSTPLGSQRLKTASARIQAMVLKLNK